MYLRICLDESNYRRTNQQKINRKNNMFTFRRKDKQRRRGQDRHENSLNKPCFMDLSLELCKYFLHNFKTQNTKKATTENLESKMKGKKRI